MERVLKHAGVKSLFLVISLLAVAPSALATTAIIPADDEMIVAARAIVRGKVVSVEVGLDGQNRIFTYVTLKVQEVLKGQITERRIVIKEPGGEVGNRGSIVFGTPRFARGDKVLLYLDTWQDGSLRVHQMFLGRFSIVQDAGRDELLVTRNVPDAGVSVLGQSTSGPITNRMELTRYTEMVRNRLAANLEHSREFEAKVYGNTPVLARPIEYKAGADGGDLSPQFHLWNPPIRWFQADSGQSVVFKTNPDGAPNPEAITDAAAAMNAWSTVPGCSLRVADGGATEGCGLFALDGENSISFNNCDGYFSGSGTCSSGILAVASIANYDRFQTKVVNGVSFAKALESNISFNPFSACNFSNHCNVQEITTHEMGHALGLHHSWDPTFGGSPSASDQIATMYYIAHFDGRCASLRTDDVNGITFIYPSSGGGPGPLTIVTSSLAGGTVGTPYSQSVSASGGTLPYTWSLVQGQGALPPGLSLSAGGVITGTPTTAGTNNFTVRVTDNAAATAQRALGIVVNAAGGGGALNSQFVSQTVPTTLQPDQEFTVNMKFQNTGTQTWSGSAYYFASQNPPLNQTWGGNGVPLLGFTAAPGEQLDVTFIATAPTTPGTYNFQWQMYQDGGVGFFGQMSQNVAINVGTSTHEPSFDFDGDGKTDVAVWHPGDGTWYIINSGDGSTRIVQWGASGLPYNIPVPADYDGDGKTDIAVWHPGDGTWYIINSSNGSTRIVRWGSSPEPYNVPVPADYDGDGKADIAVWHPGDGTWYIMNSSNGSIRIVQWGASGQPFNIPVPADYDGDSKADIAVWHPGDGTWYIINSSDGSTRVVQWGASGQPYSAPMPADYDGDGKADIAVWNPGSGYWYIINSSNGSTTTLQWGSSPQPYSTPVPADYDGDGKADIAVWHPGDGTWYIVNSSNGSARIQQWGASGVPYNVAAPGH